MKVTRLLFIALLTALWSSSLLAADVFRQVVAEIDPIAPASAAYEEGEYATTTSKWGINVDFNMGGAVSTGPDLWLGSFNVKGPEDAGTYTRREDFQHGERHKLEATRLRWTFKTYERPRSMRGWYFMAGYNYVHITSRANRITEESDPNDAFPEGVLYKAPSDETDFITDTRHGVTLGLGERWMLSEQKITINFGLNITSNFKRSISVQSKDENALADYEEIIEELPDTRMSARPMPEANFSVGYAW